MKADSDLSVEIGSFKDDNVQEIGGAVVDMTEAYEPRTIYFTMSTTSEPLKNQS